MFHKLFGVIAVIVAVIILFNPVALGVALNTCGTIFVLVLIIGGLIAIIV